MSTVAFLTLLYTNAGLQLIGASPYLPRQYKYNDVIPESHYRSLARRLDCDGDEAPMFDCLVSSDVLNITQVAFQVSNNHFYYDWGLVPVTDGVILQDVPSQQLLRRQVNGRRILVGVSLKELRTLFLPCYNPNAHDHALEQCE